MHIHSLFDSFMPRRAEHDLCEYLLVVYPSKEVSDKIIQEKEWFYDAYRQEVGIRVKPHIPIANFLAKEMMEDTLIRWIQRICNLQRSFIVTLNNYSGIPPHMIFLRVQDPLPFQHLAAQLKMVDSFIQSNDCPPANLYPAPQLSIARSLTSPVYEAAIRQYAQRCFHETFHADTLALLKRSHSHSDYERANTFTLPPHLSLYE